MDPKNECKHNIGIGKEAEKVYEDENLSVLEILTKEMGWKG